MSGLDYANVLAKQKQELQNLHLFNSKSSLNLPQADVA